MRHCKAFSGIVTMVVMALHMIPSYAIAQQSEYVGGDGNVYSYHLSRWGAVIDSINVNSADGAVIIPAELGGNAVDRVEKGAFGKDSDKVISLDIECDAAKLEMSELRSLKSASLGKNTLTIGKECFSGCLALSDVNISDAVVKIDIGAFRDCTALKAVSIPDSVQIICDEAFAGCSSLSDVNWSMKDIVGFNVFRDTKYLSEQKDGMLILNNGKSLYCAGDNIKSADIPEGVTYIYQFAFENTEVESITVPKSIRKIDQNAFNGARKLKDIEFKGRIDEFDTAAFQDCSSLSEFTVPDGITELPELCFSGCTALKEITLSDSIKVIGDYAFQSCARLESISFPESLEVIGNDTFERCAALKEARVPESVTRIGERAFNECKKLSVLDISGKTVIEDAAFCNTALTESSITLGSGVTYTPVEKNKKYENDPLAFLYKDSGAAAEPVYSTPKPRTTEDPEREPKSAAQPQSTEKPQTVPTQAAEAAPEPNVIDVRSGDGITVSVNDNMIDFPDAQPYIDEHERTQIPIRAVAEGLGCEVDWDDATRTAIVKRGGKTVTIAIGSDTLQVGSEMIQMDTAAVIKDERTYIPVRFVGEALGMTVNWIQ